MDLIGLDQLLKEPNDFRGLSLERLEEPAMCSRQPLDGTKGHAVLSLRSTLDDEKLLSAKLDRFSFWHGIRAAFQLLAFVVLMWALVEADVS